MTARREALYSLFRQRVAIEDACHQANLARGTVMSYLAEFIALEKPATIDAWVDAATYQRVAAAAHQVGADRLKPIFLALDEQVPYDAIRLVVAHLGRISPSSSEVASEEH
jgi:ATP-dependent DNA helicase RecQ